MLPSAEQVYPPKSESVRTARWFCVDYLRNVLVGTDDEVEAVLDDVRLIVSELMTNAIQARPTQVRLEIVAGVDHVRISVADDGAGTPTPRRPQSTTEHGRGLWIVEQIAKCWGTSSRPDGKEVWAEIALAPDLIWMGD